MPPCPAALPCPADSSCWLYLVRHGATEYNEARPPLLQGQRIDACLSARGRQQAESAAQRLAAEPVARVYASPLLRARQTAEAIARRHGLAVQPADDLIEVDVGQWEGHTWEDIARVDAEAYRLFTVDAGTNPYLGGENLAAVRTRVVAAMERILADNVGRLVVVVAHNVVNRVYLAHLLQMPLAHYRSISQENCGLNLLRYHQGQVRAVTINAIDHLEQRPV